MNRRLLLMAGVVSASSVALGCAGVQRRATEEETEFQRLLHSDADWALSFPVERPLISAFESGVLRRLDNEDSEPSWVENPSAAASYALLIQGGEVVRAAINRRRWRSLLPAAYARFLSSTGTVGDVDELLHLLLNYKSQSKEQEQEVLERVAFSLKILMPETIKAQLEQAAQPSLANDDRRTVLIDNVLRHINRGRLRIGTRYPKVRSQLIAELLSHQLLFSPIAPIFDGVWPQPRIWYDRDLDAIWHIAAGALALTHSSEISGDTLRAYGLGEDFARARTMLPSFIADHEFSAGGRLALLRLSGRYPRVLDGAEIAYTFCLDEHGWRLRSVL